jgi:hypothetical protein
MGGRRLCSLAALLIGHLGSCSRQKGRPDLPERPTIFIPDFVARRGRPCNRHPMPTDAPEITLAMTGLALARDRNNRLPMAYDKQSWFGTGTSATLLTMRSAGAEPGLIRS